ncbi:M20 metallopeptidase family protein [Hydrogenophaga atypica]|uniref:M20 family metallopeptidase n=1 Tax=Hydrogenophaga atypica TaxID=249409 RepID=A0ABW2QPH2_9BURK
MHALVQSSQALGEQLRTIRRALHMQPELSFAERHTADLVRRELDRLGVPWVTVGEHGVVATVEGQHQQQMVLLRADMDALPIQEENDHLSYRSRQPGAMHACGHDGHVAMLLGAAQLLQARRAELPGTVKLCFQQAEERGGGTAEMLEHLRPFPLIGAFAIHLWSELEAGKICTRAGPRMAGCDNFSILLEGRGTHGAHPHRGVDPLRAACVLLQEASSLPGREIDPTHAAVLSFGRLQAGQAGNVIPHRAELAGSIRAALPEDGVALKVALERVVAGVAAAHRVQARLDIKRGGGALVNDARCSELATQCVHELFGADASVQFPPLMVSENFGDFFALCPGLMALVGAQNPSVGACYPHHHPKFNIDEDALTQGAALMAAYALRSLA